MSKFLYPIKNLEIMPWIKYYLLKRQASPSYPLSEIIEGTSPLTLANSIRKKFHIFNVGGNTKQQSYTGKNILETTAESYTLPASSTTYQKIYNTKPYLEAGTKYYISYDIDNASASNTRSTPRLYLNQEYVQYPTANSNLTVGRKVWEFTPTVSGNYEVQYWLQGSNTAVKVSKFMISTSSDTDYEPYVGGQASPNPSYPQPVENVSGEVEVKVANGTDSTAQGYEEQTATLHLPEGMEMCEGDGFVWKNEKWYKNKIFQKVIFDGTENWKTASADWHRYYIEISDVLKQGQILSDYFIRDIELQDHNKELYGKIDTGYWNDGFIFIQDYKAFTTLAEFKTWLSSHNTTVYYQLKEPLLEEITHPTLISDLENLKSLYSYKGTTYISSSNEPSPVFEVQYYMEEGA